MLKLKSTNTEYSDEELLDLLRLGDAKAFELIYLKYWRKMFSIAYNWVKSEEIAKELVQDLFTSIWEKRENLIIHKTLSAYINASIRYIVFDFIDAKNVRQRYLKHYKESAQFIDNSTQEKLSYDELSLILEKGIQSLPEKAQSVFNMSKREHLSAKEIAERLNISVKTVEYHLNNAKNYLRKNCKDFIVSIALMLISL
jgi:RNA polymerase sigma-70 factor (family 1)